MMTGSWFRRIALVVTAFSTTALQGACCGGRSCRGASDADVIGTAVGRVLIGLVWEGGPMTSGLDQSVPLDPAVGDIISTAADDERGR